MAIFVPFTAQNPTHTSGSPVRISDDGQVVVGHFSTPSPMFSGVGDADYYLWNAGTFDFRQAPLIYPNVDGSITTYRATDGTSGLYQPSTGNNKLYGLALPYTGHVMAISDRGTCVGHYSDANGDEIGLYQTFNGVFDPSGIFGQPVMLQDLANGVQRMSLKAVTGNGQLAVGTGTNALGSVAMLYRAGYPAAEPMPFVAGSPSIQSWMNSISHNGRLAVGGRGNGNGLVFDFSDYGVRDVSSTRFADIQLFAVASEPPFIAVGMAVDLVTEMITALVYVFDSDHLTTLQEVLDNQGISYSPFSNLLVAFDISSAGDRIVGRGEAAGSEWSFLAEIDPSAI